MTTGLRPRQIKAIEDLQAAYRDGYRSPILVAPTAFGKTHTAATIIRRTLAKGRSVWFMAHLREIIRATAGKLDTEGIPYGYVAAGHPYDSNQSVQIVSVMTAARRFERAKYAKPGLLIIDECDLAEAQSYKTVISALGNPPLLGLTATPERLDGRGLKDIFDIIVPTCGTMDLIDEGLAPTVRYFNCNPGLTSESLHKRAGEFQQDEVSALMDRPALIGDAVRSWEQHAKGRPTIYFTSGIKHAINTAAAFCASGYRAIAVSGESEDDERDAALIDLRAGRIDIVCNAQLWIAGVDCPNVSCIGLLYITASLRKYLQSIGRGMRLCDGHSDTIILDHGNNLSIHGNPLAQRQWSLDGREARRKAEDKDDVAIKQCPMPCGRFVRSQVMACPVCGHVWTPQAREIRQVEGNLSEVDLSRQIARVEQGRAGDVDSLVKVFIARGMSPQSANRRAHIIISARNEKAAMVNDLIADLNQMKLWGYLGVTATSIRRMKPKALKELRGRISDCIPK